MFKKIISIVPVAALLTVGATAQASTITVQQGDTLWDLARANNSSVEIIQSVNHLNTDLIHPGDILTIAQEKRYTVQNGDTLWDIALDNDVTVSQIKEWNHLHSDIIHPDLNLLIYAGAKASETTEKTALPTVQKPKESVPEATAPATSNAGTNESKSEAAAPAVNNEEVKESAPVASNAEDKKSTPVISAPATSNEDAKESAPVASAPATSNEDAKESAPVASAPAASNEVTEESAPVAAAPATNGLKELTVQATAYTASCEGCSGITSTGINLKENPDAKVISVDPTVIPLGSKVYVEGYGEAIAGDTGGGIKGNKIDVFMTSKQDAINFGVKQLKVTILD